MNAEAHAAALAERERIAKLADDCWATYERGFQRYSFGALIRSGATTAPWRQTTWPDPLAVPPEDGTAA